MMDINEMTSKVLAIFPNAIFGEDMNGELIVSTGMMVDPTDGIVNLPEWDTP
jgi:hypothetical protein